MLENLKHHRWLLLILVGATALRFYGLAGESLWLDEGQTVKWIGGSYAGLTANWTQGQLFLFILKLWSGIAGTSEFALRFLPAVFGIAVVAAIFFFGRALFSETTGLYAALFMAVNPFAIFYSQDARPYSLFLLGSITALLCAIRLAQTDRTRYALGYGLSVLVTVYSHPFAPFLIPTHVLAFILFRRKSAPQSALRLSNSVIVILAATLCLALPQVWCYAQRFAWKTETNLVAAWIPRPTFTDLWKTPAYYFMFRPSGYAVILLIGVIALWKVLWKETARAALFVLLSLLFCAWILPWILSRVVTPIYVLRYTIPALSAFVVLLGWALTELKPVWRRGLVVVLGVLMVIPLYHYYTKIDKDPWRQTAGIVQGQLKSGDNVVYYNGLSRAPFEYYCVLPAGVQTLPISNLEDLASATNRAQRIWLILSYDSGPSSLTSGILETLARGWKPDFEISMTDRIHKNPHAYFVADIKVKRYVRA